MSTQAITPRSLAISAQSETSACELAAALQRKQLHLQSQKGRWDSLSDSQCKDQHRPKRHQTCLLQASQKVPPRFPTWHIRIWKSQGRGSVQDHSEGVWGTVESDRKVSVWSWELAQWRIEPWAIDLPRLPNKRQLFPAQDSDWLLPHKMDRVQEAEMVPSLQRDRRTQPILVQKVDGCWDEPSPWHGSWLHWAQSIPHVPCSIWAVPIVWTI